MPKVFKIHKNFWDEREIYHYDELQIDKGITCLIGCNGAGKSTLAKQIMIPQLRDSDIEPQLFDNYISGGRDMTDLLHPWVDAKTAATSALSSEGEKMMIWMGFVAKKIGEWYRANPDKDHWIFFDALDSGLSINNIVYIKDALLSLIAKSEPNAHIIITCNSFELARGYNCIDVQTGETFIADDYEEYKRRIIKSGETKNKSLDDYYDALDKQHTSKKRRTLK